MENNGSSSLHFRPRPHTFIFIAIFSSTSTYHHHEAKQWEFHFRPHPQLSFSSTLFFSCGSSLNFQQTTFQSEISVLASELQTKNYLQVIIILSLKCHQNSDPRQAFLTYVFLSDDFNCVRHCLCLLLTRSLGQDSAQHFNFKCVKFQNAPILTTTWSQQKKIVSSDVILPILIWRELSY